MNTIVVTGATGNVGRPLVQALVDAGEQVVAVSRNVAQVPDGVRHRQADLTKPETFGDVLDGADALFLLTAGEVIANGDLTGIMAAAKAARVGRVVLLSSQGVGTQRHSPALEDTVRESGLETVVLRAGGFSTNALQWADSIRAERVLVAPFGDVGLPLVDPADLAEVAAVVLRDPGHDGMIYTLTGPAPISPREQAAAIAAALGEDVRFDELTRAEAKARMLQFMPEPVAEATLDILGDPTTEEREVSPDVEKLTGRPPRRFAEWAADNVEAFR